MDEKSFDKKRNICGEEERSEGIREEKRMMYKEQME